MIPLRTASSADLSLSLTPTAVPIRIDGYRSLLLPAGRFPEPWRKMLARHDTEERAAASSLDCQCSWRHLVDEFSGRPVTEALLWEIQSAVNRVKWVSDPLNYEVADWWATPREFLANGGDCEDFATVKYLLLRRLGVKPADLAVVVCYDSRTRKAHAVTTCNVRRKVYTLDNLTSAPIEGWPWGRYRPFYCVNEELWALYSSEPDPYQSDKRRHLETAAAPI